MAFHKLHVMKGTVNGQMVQAIRDTGCTIVGVKQDLMHPSQCTGEDCLLVMVDNTTKSIMLNMDIVHYLYRRGNVIWVKLGIGSIWETGFYIEPRYIGLHTHIGLHT